MNQIDKIFVLTLKDETERHTHVQKQFEKFDIDNYEFHYAFEQNSSEVKEAYRSGIVSTYPNCFRCGQEKCKCFNNILVPTQVSNFLSYHAIMKKILDEELNLVLLCEDDILFYDYGISVLSQILQNITIDYEKPFVLRLGSNVTEHQQYHNKREQVSLVPYISMSNPCFMVNRKYAELFVQNFQKIEMTSDMFMHIILGRQGQNFTVVPQIAKELSWDSDAIFESTIHNQKNTRQKKRIESIEEYKTFYEEWIA